jgi:hypothetical protein
MGIKGQIQKTVNKKASRIFDWLLKIIRESFSSLIFSIKAQKN